MGKRTALLLAFIFTFVVSIFFLTQAVRAYTTGMSASTVLGQSGFTSNGSGTSSQQFNKPTHITSDGKRFIVTDTSNSRVLIYNTIPTTTNQAANVVVGQSNMTNSQSANTSGNFSCGLSFVNDPSQSYDEGGAFSDSTRLYVADTGNNRVLIYNGVPTVNGECPNVVVGQTGLGAVNSGTTQTTMDTPTRVFVNNGKMFVVDQQNSRILIYNSIPTSNGASASVVVGQPNFTTSSTNSLQSRFDNPHSATTDGTRLFVADTENHRVLIFNSIPTTNGASASVVLGQSDFTSNTVNPPSSDPTATNVGYPEDIYTDGKRLVVSDAQNDRVMIWSTIPTANNTPADVIIGQDDFNVGITNNGILGATGLNDPAGVFSLNDKLYIADKGNNRVLVYNNLIGSPGVELNNVIYDGANGLSRMKGSAYATITNDTIKNVTYSVNGGPAQNATPESGSFSDAREYFHFDFDQKANNNKNEGFTASVVATNQNSDISDKLFYFQPFIINGPPDNSFTNNKLPTFEFSVNKQQAVMSTNIDSYQVEVKDSDTSEWQVYAADIPVDFKAARLVDDKVRAEPIGATDSDNGVYETADYIATYTDGSSHITIHGKDPNDFYTTDGMGLSGTTQWKVSMIDKQDHFEETSTRTIRIGSSEVLKTTDRFPLAILSISGVKNPNLSTDNLNDFVDVYHTKSSGPIFYGIANVGTNVTLEIQNKSCTVTKTNSCKMSYSTTTNGDSRFGINVPPGTLIDGEYTVTAKVQKDGNFNQLPTFTLMIGQASGAVEGASTNIPISSKPKQTGLSDTTQTAANYRHKLSRSEVSTILASYHLK